MNLQDRTVIKIADYPQSRYFEGVYYPCNIHGDLYVKISKEIFDTSLIILCENEALKQMLQDAIPPVNNIIDIINYFYPFMKLDENNEFVPLPQNATLRDIISKSFLYESDNFVIFKTGIYNLYTENKQPVIWRNNVPTALFEIHLALNLVKLSYNEIVLNENVFENNPFPQTYDI